MAVVDASEYGPMPSNPWSVSFRFLLALYALVPLVVVIVCWDALLNQHGLRDWLPVSPSHFLLFQVLFGTPHIIASNLLLVSHREYLQTFKRKLLLMSGFIVLVFGVGSLFIPYRVLYLISAAWTVYHVLKQQHGVAKAVCRLPNRAFYLQLWMSVLAGFFIYVGIFLNQSLDEQQSYWISQLAIWLSAGLLSTTLLTQRYVKTRMGLGFLWANTALVLASGLVYLTQYYFLAILMPRLVHDITAYSFYVTHDVNRQAERPQSGLYWLARRIGLSVAWVLPLSSFALTWWIQVYGDAAVNLITENLFGISIYKAMTLGVVGYLALMHYYSEAFVWAAGSPLRRYIRFSGL